MIYDDVSLMPNIDVVLCLGCRKACYSRLYLTWKFHIFLKSEEFRWANFHSLCPALIMYCLGFITWIIQYEPDAQIWSKCPSME